MFIRWESATRYFEIHVGKDLLGDLMFEKRWGGKFNRQGNNFKTKVTKQEAQAMIADIAETRRKHKYVEKVRTVH
jgi:hypothetical protein